MRDAGYKVDARSDSNVPDDIDLDSDSSTDESVNSKSPTVQQAAHAHTANDPNYQPEPGALNFDNEPPFFFNVRTGTASCPLHIPTNDGECVGTNMITGQHVSFLPYPLCLFFALQSVLRL